MGEHSFIDPDDVSIRSGSVLGDGGAGQVLAGTLRRRERGGIVEHAVAIKMLDAPTTSAASVPRELQLLVKAIKSCEFVCKPYGYTVKQQKACLILHRYQQSLAQYIESYHDEQSRCAGERAPLREVVRIGKQLAEALRLLHDARIAHFDIKPENILLDAAGTCYLCDFSIAHVIPDGQRAIPLPQDAYGSARYMAPEQVKDATGKGIGVKADVWAAAATLYAFYFGQPPFADMHNFSVLQAVSGGQTPSLPAGTEPRFAAILKRCFVFAPEARQDSAMLRHSLSQLLEVLRVESGGSPAVPRDVLSSADVNLLPNQQERRGHSSAEATATPAGAEGAPLSQARDRAAASQPDLLSGEPLPAVPLQQRAGSDGAVPGAPPSGHPSGYEPVVISTGNTGTLGVRCLFRSFTRLLKNPGDERQVTGAAMVPRDVADNVAREAVSVSAGKMLTWWDLSEGRLACSVELSHGGKMSPEATGRSIAVSARFAAVGTDRSTIGVWRFAESSSATCGTSAALPECVALTTMSSPVLSKSGRAPAEGANKIYDLSLQPAWMEDRGARWLAGASSLGNMALWDTETWQEIYATHVQTSGTFYSCCAMPGSNMVALACRAPHLVQLFDCRSPPHNVAVVLSCQVDVNGTRGGADDAVYCVACVPARGAAVSSQLLLGTKEGRVCVWDLRQPATLLTVARLDREKVLGCAVSPCGTRILAGASRGQVVMLDWKGVIAGRQTSVSASPFVSHWEQDSHMYKWPKVESGILRLATCNLARGSLFAPLDAAQS